MILPTPRAVVALAVVSPLALLGYLTSFAVDAVILIDVVIIGAIWFDARRAVDPKRLEIERISPVGFSAGHESEVTYRWSLKTGRDGVVVVREFRPEIMGGVQPIREIVVAKEEPTTETLRVHPASRGRASDGWFALRCPGPWGLALRQTRIDKPWDVTVFPAMPTSRLKSSLADAINRREVGLRSVRALGAGRTFESLREWVPGDDTRHIDWKATARRRKIITRQYEEERRQQVLLVLDAGRLMTAEVGGQARFEYTVRAALSLAIAAHRYNDNIGIMVFADTVQHYVAPQRGHTGLRRVLEVLAGVRPVLVEPDYPGAFRYLALHNRKRALTVLFTDVIDAMASEALVSNARSLSRRHLPLTVTVRNPDLDLVAGSRPTTPYDAYRKAAAEELLAAREGALTKMRRAGSVVIDVPPENASVQVVEKYIELKRRGRL